MLLLHFSYLGLLFNTIEFVSTCNDSLKQISRLMAAGFLSQLYLFLLMLHKASVTTLRFDVSTFIKSKCVCPFIDAVALVQPLIFEFLSLLFSIRSVFSLLILLITMARRSEVTVS